MTDLFLGIDGGQSSTTAMIGDSSGRVVGFGQGGPCNHVGAAEGRQKLIRAVTECVGKACEQAGVTFEAAHFAAACMGFSGGPEDKERILAELLRCALTTVTTDALIALSGATAGDPGIITIAGTGSIAYGRNCRGNSARAGGWGYLFGDEGGGFDITRQALRAALRYEEGWGPFTTLHERLLQETASRDANQMMHRFYTTEFPRPRIASMSKLVDEAAREGDRIAREILERAAQELATLVGAVRAQLFEADERVFVAYVGGVFRSELLRERYKLLVELEPANHAGPPIYGPAAGALVEAYRAAGITVPLRDVPSTEK